MTQEKLKPFRYSGSKTKFLDYYKPPVEGTKRIIEPYLGSGAYLLNTVGIPGVGYETSPELYALWIWLQSCTETDLLELNQELRSVPRDGSYDIRKLKLPLGMQTYVRINVCSIVVGQLASWRIHPHRLPIAETVKALPRIKELEIHFGQGETHNPIPGDAFFIDPPYIGTNANYGKVSAGKRSDTDYDPETTNMFLEKTQGYPVTFTYGDRAKELFPSLDWVEIKKVQVPNIRRGGTVPRTEHLAFRDW